jgi:hypothetical protein
MSPETVNASKVAGAEQDWIRFSIHSRASGASSGTAQPADRAVRIAPRRIDTAFNPPMNHPIASKLNREPREKVRKCWQAIAI